MKQDRSSGILQPLGIRGQVPNHKELSRLIEVHTQRVIPPPRNRNSFLLRQKEHRFILITKENIRRRLSRNYNHQGLKLQVTKVLERYLILQKHEVLAITGLREVNLRIKDDQMFHGPDVNIVSFIPHSKGQTKLQLSSRVYQFALINPRLNDFRMMAVLKAKRDFIKQERDRHLKVLLERLPQREILKLNWENRSDFLPPRLEIITLNWPFFGYNEILEGIAYSTDVENREPLEETLIRKEAIMLLKFSKVPLEEFEGEVDPIPIKTTVDDFYISTEPKFNQTHFTLRHKAIASYSPKHTKSNYKPALRRPSAMKLLQENKPQSRSPSIQARPPSRMVTLTDERLRFQLPSIVQPAYRLRLATEGCRTERASAFSSERKSSLTRSQITQIAKGSFSRERVQC